MSRKRNATRKKGVTLKSGDRGQSTSPVRIPDQGAVLGDIYESVVASMGFDPIKEAQERRRLM